MNFKMKAVVAAIALTASMSASADLTQSAFQAGSTSKIGDSSLILTLIDNSNSISATFDLGYSYSSFAESLVTAPAGPNLVWDLAGNANYAAAWSSFTSTANLAGSHWAVFAGDNNGTGAGAKGMIVTYTSLPAQTVLTTELSTQLAGMDVYIADNASLGNHASVAAGGNTTVLGTEWAGQSGAYNANGMVGNKGPVTWGSFDQSLGVVKFTSAASVGARVASDVYANQFGASQFKLGSNGQLVFTAPVPEADTWAMLLAGLGLMGFIARRRTAA